MSSLQHILDCCPAARPSGDDWQAKCSAHDDNVARLLIDLAVNCLPRSLAEELLLAWANRTQRSIIKISQLDLRAMNRGESVTKRLQGVEVLRRPRERDL